MEKCDHLEFQADVTIDRIIKNEGDIKPTAFMCDVRVKCVTCGTPFEFIGPQCGYMFDRPCVDVSAQELRIPIQPKGIKLLPDFTVRAN
jgi:hypothetical protein